MIDPISSSTSSAIGRASLPVSGPATALSTGSKDVPAETMSVRTTARSVADLGPPIDADRVAALKAAIADGSYSVDPGKIADALIAAASDQR